MDFEKRLQELFIELPEVQRPIGAAIPWVQSGKLLLVGGAYPYSQGKLSFKGRLGLEVSTDQGALAARHAALYLLSCVRAALGSLNKVVRIVQLTGYIASGGDFKEHEKVLDGASSLFRDVFGSHGVHTRVAAGVGTLPHGACLELSLIVEV